MGALALLHRSRLGIGLTLALVTAWAAMPRVHAADTAQASVNGGMGFFAQPTNGLLAQYGFVLQFQVEPREYWIRPAFGALLEMSFGTNRLIDGHMLAGGELIAARAVYFKPFLGAFGDFGWANFTTATQTYNGLLYGFMLTAGTELRFSERDHAVGLRILTAYRFLLGTIGGGISGSDLNSINVLLGVTF